MSDHHLVVNVEEQHAKRLFDAGFTGLAREALGRAQSLSSGTRFEELEHSRRVPVTKEEHAQRKSSAADAALRSLERHRNALLAASDWRVLPDSPEPDKDAWVAYRQQLRDLPANTKDPAKVKWPEPPA
jgi:hypothetical protein